jgi:hypothetical protein
MRKDQMSEKTKYQNYLVSVGMSGPSSSLEILLDAAIPIEYLVSSSSSS